MAPACMPGWCGRVLATLPCSGSGPRGGGEAETPVSSAPSLQLLVVRGASASRSAAGPNDFCKKKAEVVCTGPSVTGRSQRRTWPCLHLLSSLLLSPLLFSRLSLSSLSPSFLLSRFLPHLATLSFSLLPAFLPSYLLPHSSPSFSPLLLLLIPSLPFPPLLLSPLLLLLPLPQLSQPLNLGATVKVPSITYLSTVLLSRHS